MFSAYKLATILPSTPVLFSLVKTSNYQRGQRMSDETPLKYVQSREEFPRERKEEAPWRADVDPGQRFLENDHEWACVTRLPGDRSSQWEGGKAWIPGAKGQQADDTGKKGTLERHEPSLRPSRLPRCVCVGDHGRTVGRSPGGESDGGVVGEGSAWWGAVAPPTGRMVGEALDCSLSTAHVARVRCYTAHERHGTEANCRIGMIPRGRWLFSTLNRELN